MPASQYVKIIRSLLVMTTWRPKRGAYGSLAKLRDARAESILVRIVRAAVAASGGVPMRFGSEGPPKQTNDLV
jgi:hypothetical protein